MRLGPLSNTMHAGTSLLSCQLRGCLGFSGERLHAARWDEFAHASPRALAKRKEYTTQDVKLLKAHSKARTPVSKVSKLMKRSEGSLRQKARTMGIGLGHQR